MGGGVVQMFHFFCPRLYHLRKLLFSVALLGCKIIITLSKSQIFTVGGAVASWLARSTLERVLQVRALAGDIVLCSWARHFTLMVPLSTQVYKWVPANLMLGVTLQWTSIPSRGE